MARALIAVLMVLLPGLVLGPAWRLSGLGPSEDEVLYYLPTRVFFADSVGAGAAPWLNPWNGLGRPFMADPQTAVFYPATWVFAVLPPLAAYPLVLWGHYSLALGGAYRLLRGRRLGRAAALFGAIAFGLGGFMLAHRAHFTMVHAAAWLPWVLWAVGRLLARSDGARVATAALLAAAQMFSGHLQISALTCLASGVLCLAEFGRDARRAASLITAWGLAAGLFAVQLVPTGMYLRACTRVEQTYLQFTENSWNPASLIGLVLPMAFGQRTPNFFPQEYWGPSHQVEQFAYPGIVTLLLAALALPGWRWDGRRRPWVVLLIFAALLALGLYGPVCPILYWVPVASVFRVPARALLLVNLALAVLAAYSVQALREEPTPANARLRARMIDMTKGPWRLAALLWLAGVVPLLLSGMFVSGETAAAWRAALDPRNPALWVSGLVILASSALLGWIVRRWQSPASLAALVPLLVADLAVIGWTLDVPAGVASPQALLSSAEREQWQPFVRDGRRVWIVTRREDGRPGEYVDSVARGVADTNLFEPYACLTDYGPLQPRRFARVFGFEPWGEHKNPAPLLEDSAWMGPCDVGWVLLCDASLPAPRDAHLTLETPGGLRLYEYRETRGVVFLETPHPAVIVCETPSPNRLDATIYFSQPEELASFPADARPLHDPVLVIASRLALPGWSVTVNGQAAAGEAVSDLLLGVRVEPRGEVRIAWRYRPPGLWSGATISVMSALICGGLCLWGPLDGERS